jgi:hypothetical protein
MSASSPNPVLRGRIEFAIRVASPFLDLMLAAGDRLSRLLVADDPDYVPARMPSEGEAAPRGLSPRRPVARD